MNVLAHIGSRLASDSDGLDLRALPLEALPARFEGVLRKHMLVRDGQRRDSACYRVIDDDWPAVRANLERRLTKYRRRGDGEATT